MNGHPLATLGWALVILGLVLYLGAALFAMIRVKRQYSRAMRGGMAFALGAGLAAASRWWWLATPIVVGVALIAVGR